MVRVTHKREFDAKAVKIDLGLLDKSWENFVANLKRLADKKMDNSQLTQFVSTVFKDPAREVGKQAWGVERLMQTIIGKAKDGSGADMHRGTRWGALCGITEALTHRDSSRLSNETRFTEAYMGVDATTKMNAYLELLILA